MIDIIFTILLVALSVSLFVVYLCLKKTEQQVTKLRGQLYYWSRQIPIGSKKGRPSKQTSVK